MPTKRKIAVCPHFTHGTKKEKAKIINEKLMEFYPDAVCALNFGGDPFRLLVMARLSAQCTDKRVNEVSEKLFERFPDAASFAVADVSEIEEYVRPCGLFRTKAKSIKEMSVSIVNDYKGEVPREKEKLLALSGVGEKIANLMLGDVFGDPQIVADTHLIRLSNRFGLVSTTDPMKVTREMEKLVPKTDRADFCHRAITLGREFCKAQRPDCDNCPFSKNV